MSAPDELAERASGPESDYVAMKLWTPCLHDMWRVLDAIDAAITPSNVPAEPSGGEK